MDVGGWVCECALCLKAGYLGMFFKNNYNLEITR